MPRKQGMAGSRRRNKKAPSRDRAFSASYCLGSNDAHVFATKGAFGLKLDHAVHFREQGVILAQANAVTGVEFGAALTNQDVASLYSLAAEQFHAKAFTF